MEHMLYAKVMLFNCEYIKLNSNHVHNEAMLFELSCCTFDFFSTNKHVAVAIQEQVGQFGL